MSEECIVRRLRVIEYVGPESWVNEQIERRCVKGSHIVSIKHSESCGTIREAVLGDTNEFLREKQ